MKLKRSSVFLIVVMGLLATSGIALAGHEDGSADAGVGDRVVVEVAIDVGVAATAQQEQAEADAETKRVASALHDLPPRERSRVP